MIYYPTVIAQYSLFVLKVPLNPKQAIKQAQYLVACYQAMLTLVKIAAVTKPSFAGTLTTDMFLFLCLTVMMLPTFTILR